MRVLIVGAGPTGLSAAVELARRGVIAKVIEKKSARSRLSRAVGILPHSLDLLMPSGVSERLLENGIKVKRLNFYNNKKHLSEISFQNTTFPRPYLLTLAQDKTEEILESVFSTLDGQVRYSTALTGINQSGNTVIAKFSQGNQEEFDFILAADGTHSRTRQSAGLDFPGFELAQTWSIADVDADHWLHPYELTVCLLNKGQAGVVVPLETNRYRLISNTADVLSSLPLPLNINTIRRRGQFKIAVRQLGSYRRGRVYFAGDAAHCHSPFGGRGMNLGIADAVEFATCLIDNSLDHYCEARHLAGLKAISESEQLRNIITTTNPLLSGLMKVSLGVIKHTPKLQGVIANKLLQN